MSKFRARAESPNDYEIFIDKLPIKSNRFSVDCTQEKFTYHHRRQSWGVRGSDPQILKWEVVGVVEGVVSGLLRSKREGREPRTPSFQTRLTPLHTTI
jgi:hypothetical protein